MKVLAALAAATLISAPLAASADPRFDVRVELGAPRVFEVQAQPATVWVAGHWIRHGYHHLWVPGQWVKVVAAPGYRHPHHPHHAHGGGYAVPGHVVIERGVPEHARPAWGSAREAPRPFGYDPRDQRNGRRWY